MLRLKFAQQDVIEQWSKKAWNNQRCSYLVAFWGPNCRNFHPLRTRSSCSSNRHFEKMSLENWQRSSCWMAKFSVGACILAAKVWESRQAVFQVRSLKDQIKWHQERCWGISVGGWRTAIAQQDRTSAKHEGCYVDSTGLRNATQHRTRKRAEQDVFICT